MTAPLLLLDTLSDRREIWSLLHRLSPARRLAFLWWVCKAASKPGANCPEPVPEMREYVRQAMRCDRADERLTNMVYADTWAVANQYDFDMGRGAVALERYARTGELPPVRPAPPATAAAPSSRPASPAPARTPGSTGSARPGSPSAC